MVNGIILKTRLTMGIVLFFSGVAFPQFHLYTFSGGADLGVDDIGLASAGIHYIGLRADTVYAV